jgi:hypothetical protein
VTPSTIADLQITRQKRCGRGEGNRKNRHLRSEVLHNLRSLA